MELASCQHSGAQNVVVAHRFMDDLCIPDQRLITQMKMKLGYLGSRSDHTLLRYNRVRFAKTVVSVFPHLPMNLWFQYLSSFIGRSLNV